MELEEATADFEESREFIELSRLYVQVFGRPPGELVLRKLEEFRRAVSHEAVMHALEQTGNAGVTTFGYCEKILERYRRSGFRSLDDVLKADEARRASEEVVAPRWWKGTVWQPSANGGTASGGRPPSKFAGRYDKSYMTGEYDDEVKARIKAEEERLDETLRKQAEKYGAEDSRQSVVDSR
jgi:hypothetical protein